MRGMMAVSSILALALTIICGLLTNPDPDPHPDLDLDLGGGQVFNLRVHCGGILAVYYVSIQGGKSLICVYIAVGY